MKTNKDYIDEAIADCIGDVKVGDVVAHQSSELSYGLADIVGNMGVCVLPDGSKSYFLAKELFDVNKVKDRAINKMMVDALIVDRSN